MSKINEIIADYTSGRTDAETANTALTEVGALFRFCPGQHTLTEAEERETTVGYYPEQANGWGLLDTGTGSMEKIRVVNGRLGCPVNQVLEDGATNMRAYVHICGRSFEVFGDTLGFRREG